LKLIRDIVMQFIVWTTIVVFLLGYPLFALLIRFFQIGISKDQRCTLFELLTVMAKKGAT